jgi:hypothetical protein
MTRARIASFLIVLAAAAAALAADVLDDYQTRYTKTAVASAKEDVLKALSATGKPEALKALQFCVVVSKAAIEDARDRSDKAHAKLAPIEAKIAKKEEDYVNQLKKQGKPVPATRPRFPEDDEALEAHAQCDREDATLASEEAILGDALDAHGVLLSKLPADVQKTVRDDWTKNRIGSKDWGVRAETYQILGHAPVPWAVEMLVLAARVPDGSEADPRALVIAIDGLSGKDAAKVTPTLVARLEDVRWLVRAAAVSALENTPSKEGIDGLVKRLQKEEGRLRDDETRALKALTGANLPVNPAMWAKWWNDNHDKWTGKPAASAPAPFDPTAKPAAPAAEERKTGFFGLQIESKRVVFVIDISGSMNEPIGGPGPDAKTTRAAYAKRELKQALDALEDGALFDIVFFSGGVKVWKPDMQKIDGKVRKEAEDYVDAAEVVGGTNTYDALEAGFGVGDMGKGKRREADPTGDARVDTIVFLSDGKPTLGRTTVPDEIRAAVKGWNKSRRIAVHAIAFGSDADEKFMKGLADDTGGSYVKK